MLDLMDKIVEEQKEFLSMMESQIKKMDEEREKYTRERENIESKFRELQGMEERRLQELNIIKEQMKVFDNPLQRF